MSIREKVEKIKSWFNTKTGQNIFISITITLVALASFGLGRLSKIEEAKTPIKLIDGLEKVSDEVNQEASVLKSQENGIKPGGQLVGSKNGSVYHLPWCSGAQRMKESNKIYFESKEEAEALGYRPAANCKGL